MINKKPNQKEKNRFVRSLISKNRYGTFFGVSQDIFDKVWDTLTSDEGNSVAYISMEIGAEHDVYSPIKQKLIDLEITEDPDPLINPFIQAYLHGAEKIPIYSGGLGVLAGDTLKSFADCKIPVVAISLLYRKGYFSQMVDSKIGQISWATEWHPEQTPGLYPLKDPVHPEKPLQIEVPFFEKGDKRIFARAHLWLKLEVSAKLDYFVPHILLDYHTPESPEWVRDAAEQLYDSSTERIKLIQRRLLGAGVYPALEAVGITSQTIHLNEQHGVSVVLHLIADALQEKYGSNYASRSSDQDILQAAREVSAKIVYTIHTPVKAGHDRFSADIYSGIGHSFCMRVLHLVAQDEDNPFNFNFTAMAMKINRATNSVSRLHKEVTQKQFPMFAEKITAITNGVHHLTWISNAKAEFYDCFREFTNWRHDPSVFPEAATLLKNKKFRSAMLAASDKDTDILIQYINQMLTNHRRMRLETWIDPPNYLSYLHEEESVLSPQVFTLGFARRFSTYKRADLIFENIDALAEILIGNNWAINFIYAGKAHPADEPGKGLIKNVLNVQEELFNKTNGLAKLVFIPGYDMKIAKMMVSGVHAWLNSPKRPLEASGTSGMKAAMNGIPNISIMDGWWVEGYHAGQTGWKFGYEGPVAADLLSEHPSSLLYNEDSESFYKILPDILKSFYNDSRDQYLDKCIMNIALNCPIFNTHRMAAEYVQRYNLVLPEEVVREVDTFRTLYCSDPDFVRSP
jgi:starch phosphorylase